MVRCMLQRVGALPQGCQKRDLLVEQDNNVFNIIFGGSDQLCRKVRWTCHFRSVRISFVFCSA